MNTQIKTFRQLPAYLLGAVVAATIISAGPAHASGVGTAVARIQSSVNSLHMGVARLGSTVEQLPQKIQDNMLNNFTDKALDKLPVDKLQGAMVKIIGKVRNMPKPDGHIVQQVTDQMKGIFVDDVLSGSVAMGPYANLLFEITGAVADKADTEICSGNMQDPTCLNDCDTGTGMGRSNPRCLVRYFSTPRGEYFCKTFEKVNKFINSNLPDDAASTAVAIKWVYNLGVARQVQGLCFLGGARKDYLKAEQDQKKYLQDHQY